LSKTPNLFQFFDQNLFQTVAIMIVISFSTPLFIIVLIPIVVIYYFIQVRHVHYNLKFGFFSLEFVNLFCVLILFVQRFYVQTSRQLKRLESSSRSPIYSHFQETITGDAIVIESYLLKLLQLSFTKCLHVL